MVQMKKYIFSILSMLLIICLFSGLASAESGILISSTLDKSTANVGDTVTFTVTLSNTGSVNYSNVNLMVPLPPGLQYVSHTSTGSYSSSNGTWNVGNLKSGVTKQLQITFNVSNTVQGQLVDLVASLLSNDQNETAVDSKVTLNVLNSTGNGTGNGTGNNTTNVTNANTVILKNVVDKSFAKPGDLLNFTINIKNNGSVDYNNLQLQILLPEGLQYVSHTANVTNKNYTDGLWSLGNLKTGVSKQFNITALVLLDSVGQNKTLTAYLVPNPQNASAKNVTAGVMVLNDTTSILNVNTTSNLVNSIDNIWKNNTLTNGTTYSALVLDSSGNPHIVYFQFPNLKYAYKTENGWINETIQTNTSSRGTGYDPSISLDSSNNPHVVYNDANSALKYAYRDQSGWHIETIANSDTSYTNIIMYNNTPRISFYNNGEETVKYAYKNGTNWVIESVAKSGGHWNSMALDSNGNPVITYHNDNSGGDLRCAFRVGPNNWSSVIVDNSSHVGSWNSLVLDSTGNPHISYILQNVGVKYAYWNGLNWICELVDNSNAQSTKLVLDQSGNPRIVYWDMMNDILKFAYDDYNSSKWSINVVNITGGASPWPSLVLDTLGVPSISYANSNGCLNYAYLEPVPAKINSTPGNGFYNAPFNVILTPDKNTTIYYTTDGSDPRTSINKKLYSGPFTISAEGNTILKFTCVGNYSYWTDVWSDIYTKNYTIDTSAPSVNANLPSGKYNTIQNVLLTSNEPATIYYTTDGSDPRYSATKVKYTLPIKLAKEGTTNLKFAALNNASSWSEVSNKTYTVSFPSASLTVSNKGTGKIYVVYYITVTLPDGPVLYKKVSATLYSGKSLVVNLGKYPVGTKFTWTESIYNKASYKKTINVYNKFTSSNGVSFTQKVYMTSVKSGHYVYAIEQTTITNSGIKGTVIRSPVRK
jgi:uncharacterized repeat protein (TIGR01451 family)